MFKWLFGKSLPDAKIPDCPKAETVKVKMPGGGTRIVQKDFGGFYKPAKIKR